MFERLLNTHLMLSPIPVDIRRRFNIYKTLKRRRVSTGMPVDLMT